MTIDFSHWGPLTVLAVIAILIVLVAGAVASIIHPSTLSFDQYFGYVVKLAQALGLGAAIGRGLHLGGRVK